MDGHGRSELGDSVRCLLHVPQVTSRVTLHRMPAGMRKARLSVPPSSVSSRSSVKL
jgi:hypothetical protein